MPIFPKVIAFINFQDNLQRVNKLMMIAYIAIHINIINCMLEYIHKKYLLTTRWAQGYHVLSMEYKYKKNNRIYFLKYDLKNVLYINKK